MDYWMDAGCRLDARIVGPTFSSAAPSTTLDGTESNPSTLFLIFPVCSFRACREADRPPINRLATADLQRQPGRGRPGFLPVLMLGAALKALADEVMSVSGCG
jgi:hypothetical protein